MEVRREIEPTGSAILQQDLCRVCRCSCSLDESTCIDLFDNNAGAVRDQFDSCGFFSTKVSARDGLPTLVCIECVQRLEATWKFQVMCVESERIFRETLSKDNQNTRERIREPDKNPSDINLLEGNHQAPAVFTIDQSVDAIPGRLTVSDLGYDSRVYLRVSRL